jgi:molybdopterin converting factor small subunit
MNISVNVRLFATLREGRFSQSLISIPLGITIQELLKKISLPESEVALILVNACHASLQTVLQQDDIISLFPPIGGG